MFWQEFFDTLYVYMYFVFCMLIQREYRSLGHFKLIKCKWNFCHNTAKHRSLKEGELVHHDDMVHFVAPFSRHLIAHAGRHQVIWVPRVMTNLNWVTPPLRDAFVCRPMQCVIYQRWNILFFNWITYRIKYFNAVEPRMFARQFAVLLANFKIQMIIW